MRREALNRLRDLQDQPFHAEMFSEKDGEIVDGYLHGSGESFPIIGGIPRIVRDSGLRAAVRHRFNWFEERYGRPLFEGEDSALSSRARRTVLGFGDEWARFDQILGDYDSQGERYFSLISQPDLTNKSVLDAGCGMGRWASYIANKSSEVWAVDLSFAVDAARPNLKGFENVHIVQADVLHLPFSEQAFDLVYSLGVLHHVPDPERGFASIVKHCRLGGQVLVYVYYALENRPRWYRLLYGASDRIRRLTSSMPRRLFRPVAAAIAVASYGALVLPAKLVKRIAGTAAAHRMPLGAYADKSFQYVYLNTVDRFGTSIEHRYRLDEVRNWYFKNGLKVVGVADGPPYWRVVGTRWE